MSIDFFTFFMQIFNLLILLFLLRKFLYLPVLKVLEDRKSILENEYKAAKIARRKAETLEQKTQDEYAKIDTLKQDIIAQSHQEAQKLSKKLSDEAEKEFQKERSKWKNKLISEQNTFELAIQNLIIEYFKKFSENALNQMADVTLNELFLHKLMQKISALRETKKSEFIRDLLCNKDLEIVSSEELNSRAKQKFKEFMQSEFSIKDNPKIKFSTDKSLICGVQIKAKEQMIEWNLAEYIADFANNLNAAVSTLINKD